MNTLAIAAVGGFALLLAGCETTGASQSMASAPPSRECTTVVVTSTAEQMRLQNQQGVPADGIKQAEGQLALGRIQRDNPRAIGGPLPREQNLASQALREC